jgi:hypothetical protein
VLRDRIVDERAHGALVERPLERVAAGMADHEQVVDGARVRRLRREPHPRTLERRAVHGGERAALLGPTGQMAERDAEERGLELVEPAVEAEVLVMVTVLLAAVPELAQGGRERGIVDEDGAAVAESAEVLRGIERERARVADRPHRAPLVLRAVGLAGVLEDGYPAAARDVQDRIEVGGAPVEVDGNDGPGAGGERAGDRVRRDVQRLRVHVHEHGPRARRQDRETRERGGVGGGDDLVAGADA